MASFNRYSESLHNESKSSSQNNYTHKNIVQNLFTAIVVSNDDPNEQDRIIARIVNLNSQGQVAGGQDKNIPDDKLPYAVPLKTGFLRSTPLVGEMVILMVENPYDLSSTRYWIGPIITSQLNLNFESFQQAYSVFYNTDFNLNSKLQSKLEPSLNLPKKRDVALQGRGDSHIILRQKEVFVAAGLFEKGSLKPNLESPCHLRMRQIENNNQDFKIKRYSTSEILSTSLNFYSNRGKFRTDEIKKFEISDDLKELGELAQKLHPSVFGDELIKVLDLIIRVLLNHIHTPQKALATTSESRKLSRYTVDGELQNIISNHVRIN